MPYNTRRKSLSLPSLGIQLPSSAKSHRSNSKTNSPEQIAIDVSTSPPAKRVKREHSSPSPLPSPRRTPSTDLSVAQLQHSQSQSQPQPQSRINAHTPPPSPGDVVNVPYRKIDLDGIKDDVVISCIEQLEKTGNRPHLIKELATVLLSTNRNISNSANPAALLSSRLTQYMKRPWTALSPCPIAKELIPVHPRKVFYYLTTQPRGELPANSDDILPPVLADLKRLTPSISDPSIADDEAEMEHRERMRFSPSPEVELFSPELRSVGAGSIPIRQPSFEEQVGSLHSIPDMPAPVHNVHHSRQRSHHRAPSPGLEADERGFTETAAVVRQSRLNDQTKQLSISVQGPEEQKPRSEAEVRLELFPSHMGLGVETNKQHMMSSPVMVPKHNLTLQMVDVGMDIDMEDASWNIKSPEATSFDELDEMFDDL